MGLRNPFRIEIDPRTDGLYVADYSPDAGLADPERGPAGHGQVGRHPRARPTTAGPTARPPSCPTSTTTSRPRPPVRPSTAPPRSTTRRTTPVCASCRRSPQPTSGTPTPVLGVPRARHRRHRRRWPVRRTSTTRHPGNAPSHGPSYYDGMPLLLRVDPRLHEGLPAGRGRRRREIEDVLPGIVTDNPMDMEFGPDGALYVLEYGDGFFAENPDAQLARIDFIGPAATTPRAEVAADPTAGMAPLTVQFSSDGTTDADGDRCGTRGTSTVTAPLDSTEANPTFTYTENGIYRATLTVPTGRQAPRTHASADVDIVVGNQAPVVESSPPRCEGSRSTSATPSATRLRSPTTSRSTARRSRDLHPRPRPARTPADDRHGLHRHARHHRAEGTTRRPTTSARSSSPSTPTAS